MPKEETIYTENEVIIIAPLKARIYKEEYDRQEFYNADGKKVVLLREKPVDNINPSQG